MNPWLELLEKVKALDIPGQLDELEANMTRTAERREALVKTLCPFGN